MVDVLRKLPVEIQQMIWEYIAAVEDRILTIDHSARPSKRNSNSRNRFVREKSPVLLHICPESRYWALSRYSSFFRPPPIKPWKYPEPCTIRSLEKACRYVGVPNYRGSKKEMEKKLTEYLNSRQGTQGTVLSKLSNKTIHRWGFVPVPVYFDPSVDTLCLSLYDSLSFLPPLYNPTHSPDFPKLRKLAFVLQKCISIGPIAPYERRPRIYGFYDYPRQDGYSTRDIRRWQLPDLQRLSLVIVQNCEVFRIEMDDENLLEPGEWSYSLVPPCYDFKDEMGPVCTGVLWKIKLAKEEGKCLMQLAVNWAPDFLVWEAHKLEIYEEDESSFGYS